MSLNPVLGAPALGVVSSAAHGRRADATTLTDRPRGAEFSAGSCLFRQGDTDPRVFEILEGVVKLLLCDAFGHEAILGVRGVGAWLGVDAALGRSPHTMTAEPVRRVRARVYSAHEVRLRAASDPEFSGHVQQLLCGELRQRTEALAGAVLLPARERLLAFLHQWSGAGLMGATGYPRCVKLPLKQWEVAQLLGIAPQYLCELLTQLEAQGELRREHPGLVLLRATECVPQSKLGQEMSV